MRHSSTSTNFNSASSYIAAIYISYQERYNIIIGRFYKWFQVYDSIVWRCYSCLFDNKCVRSGTCSLKRCGKGGGGLLYISGIHALNIENSLETCGDWHCSALDWKRIELLDSEKSVFKDWGIEKGKEIPEHTGLFNVADDLRAVLDMMVHEENLRFLKFFRDDFFGTDLYNQEFFEHVLLLKNAGHWDGINRLMQHEFMHDWYSFLCGQEGMNPDTAVHEVSDERIHAELAEQFISFMNDRTDTFILNGSMALKACYGLDHFCRDIKLSGFLESFMLKDIAEQFIREHGWKYGGMAYQDESSPLIHNGMQERMWKLRGVYESFINRPRKIVLQYGSGDTLNIEVSYSAGSIKGEDYEILNGIPVYNADNLLMQKETDFHTTLQLADLYDVVFIYKNYRSRLSEHSIQWLYSIFDYYGMERFRFYLSINREKWLDTGRLYDDVINMFSELGIKVWQ